MARESTGNDVLDELYRQCDELEDKIIDLSIELGWCDENGNFEPLERHFMKVSSELERKRIENKGDIQKEAEVTKMTIQVNRLARKIKEIEANMKNAEE